MLASLACLASLSASSILIDYHGLALLSASIILSLLLFFLNLYSTSLPVDHEMMLMIINYIVYISKDIIMSYDILVLVQLTLFSSTLLRPFICN